MSLDCYKVCRPVGLGRKFNFYHDMTYVICVAYQPHIDRSGPDRQVLLPIDVDNMQWKKYCMPTTAWAVPSSTVGALYFERDSLVLDNTDVYSYKYAKHPEMFYYRHVVPQYFGLRVLCTRVSIAQGVTNDGGFMSVDEGSHNMGQIIQNLPGGIDCDFAYWFDIFNMNHYVGDDQEGHVLNYLNDDRFRKVSHSSDKRFDINVGCELPEMYHVANNRSYIVNDEDDIKVSLGSLLRSYYHTDGNIYNGCGTPSFPGSLYICPVFPYGSKLYQSLVDSFGGGQPCVNIMCEFKVRTKFSVCASLRDSEPFSYVSNIFPQF